MEVAAVGGERAGGVDEPQALVVVVHRRADEPPRHASCLRVGEPQVDEEAALIAKERDVLTVRRQRRREEDAAARAALGQQRLRDPARPVMVAELRQEGRLDGVAPIVREVLERASQGALEGGLEPGVGGALEDLTDHLVAPLLTDVGPQRVAIPVREDSGIGGHVFDRGKVSLERGVPQPHRRFRIDRAARQVFRHAFHEPERRVHAHQCLHAGAGAAAAVHVVLELVHHLVLEDVLELGVGAGERQHGAMLEELRDAAQPLARRVDDVRLLEVGLRRVENDRLPALELVMQDPGQPGVGTLRHARGVEGADALVGIIVDVEVLGLNRLEVEVAVLHLVLAEVLGDHHGREKNREENRQD